MKLLYKIITFPVIVFLQILFWVCTGIMYCSAIALGYISPLLAILGLFVTATVSVPNGIIVLALAFLIHPRCLPRLAMRIICQLQRFRYAIQGAAIN